MYISLLPLPLLLLLLPPTKVEAKSKRGIFLHLTDLHPDPHYLYNSLESDYCHPPTQSITTSHSTLGFANEEDKLNSGSFNFNFSSHERDESSRDSSSSRRAGYFGLPSSECDTPLSLLDSTFNFISKHFSTNSPTSSSSSSSASPSTTVFDLIILTGDSARHDLDPLNYPRTLKEISNLNRLVSEKLRKTFRGGEKQVKVGVTIGNNDVFPHNVAFPGPNKVTTSLLDLWMEKGFIPEEMKRTFLRGGYYSFEVIENELLLISLNSIYFFEKNSVVEGCPPVEDDLRSVWKEGSKLMEEIDPGSEQLLWLEQQLELAKLKEMKVWIIGHVPPEESNWYKGCLEQYSELVIKHGQNVLGQFFGHMNQDHFSFLTLPPSTTTTTNSSSTNPPPSSSLLNSSPISTLDSSQLPSILYKHFKQTLSTLSSSSIDENLNEEELLLFSSFQVSPSLIPTYLPTFRIYEYNTIDDNDKNPSTLTTTPQSFKSFFSSSSSLLSFFSSDHHRKNANKRFPPKYIPLSYTQFYIPLSSLERSNKLYDDLLYNTIGSNNITKGSREWEKRLREIEPSWEIEYTTLPRREVIDRLLSLLLSSSSVVGSTTRSSLSERSPGEEDKEAEEEELVIKKEFMPREIKDFLTSVSSSSSSPRKWRSTRRKLEVLLEKYDLIPFEISTQGKEGGLSNSNWLRLAKRLVDSRDQLKKKKHKKNKNKKGKGGGRDGKMWKKWVERMGVRTGEL
ncbi:hypothetical protein JCM5350_004343 [Sporobolomyces pararoseus]